MSSVQHCNISYSSTFVATLSPAHIAMHSERSVTPTTGFRTHRGKSRSTVPSGRYGTLQTLGTLHHDTAMLCFLVVTLSCRHASVPYQNFLFR